MFKRLWHWYFNLVVKPPKKQLLLATTGYLSRPFEALGMVTATAPMSLLREERERRIQKAALKRYPEADAVIDVHMQTWLVAAGTAVKYKEE